MKVLITGITGTLGQAVTKILLQDETYEIVGISRCELKQKQFPAHERVKLHLGDIRDLDSLMRAAEGVDLIFHFAALKHVDTLEAQPLEAIKTNILGTENVLKVQKRLDIPRVVLSSTDKACYPINSYGASKALAEDLVLQNPNNVVCRYGNVIGSRGSVIPTFIRSLKDRQAVDLTHPEMTRFWIRIEDAAQFVVESSRSAFGGLKIPPMKASPVTFVAQTIAKSLGLTVHVQNNVGIRPGEKLHECLKMDHEGAPVYSNTAPQFSEAELMELVAPLVKAAA